jgi:copper homeostasis protein CutC
MIRELHAHAAGRIEVLPAGGINADNVADLVKATGCDQVHVGASMPGDDGSIASECIQLCDGRFMLGTCHRAVSGTAVAATVAALHDITSIH